MHNARLLSLTCRGVFLSLLATAHLHAQTPCDKLIDLHLDHAKVTFAALVPGGDLQPPRSAPNAKPGPFLASHCDVKGVSTPTSDSIIHFEIWMPSASEWNGKYMQLGSGGWGGVIMPRGFFAPLNRGYATAGTDDGHVYDGTGKFITGHPEKLIDFGYRAIHETSVQSRAIMNAFYGKTLQEAYFFGCSDGGREALMQAERFPEDFNGIVAGAPANNWTHQFADFVWNEKAIFANGDSILPATKLALLQSASLKACDALDGIRDGIINDPSKCHFDPAVLRCKSGDAGDCLTGAQVDAVKKIYAGLKDPVTGKQIYPGFEPGMEADISSWGAWILNRAQANYGNSNFADVVYEDAKWDWRTSNLHDDVVLADEKEAPFVNADDPDLRSFRDHGGKLIVYQGWEDTAVAPQDTIDFYNRVHEFMIRYPDPRTKETAGSIEGFYRLFMVPGMSHCGGGVGPGPNPSFYNLQPSDPDHDLAMALDRWVVDGVAPDKIIATRPAVKAQNGTPEIQGMTRPLCVYPKVARYKGVGSTNDASSFECAAESGP